MDARPDLLLHPNVPKPLHGLAPRTLLGKDWWDHRRQIAYETYQQRCWACGIPKRQAKFHSWLEAHEIYRYDYRRGRAEMVEIVAVCHACHNFIHSGRLFMKWQANEVTLDYTLSILHHGLSMLKRAGLPPNPFALNILVQIASSPTMHPDQLPAWVFVGCQKAKEYPLPSEKGNARWSDWRLVLEGREYKPLWKTYDEWYEHYTGRPRPRRRSLLGHLVGLDLLEDFGGSEFELLE